MHRHTKHPTLIILVVITLLLMVGSALAQGQPKNRAGFFGGLNLANQGGDMEMMGRLLAEELENEIGGTWSSKKSSNMGLGRGGFYTIQTSPTFGFQIEGQYIRPGRV